ncbi:phosphotransferase [Nocardia takedensis]|uniref:phosphotransferase n=1 Tax=Nocardia takedensis TaxID=259390 RepID=UPI0002EF0E19|nr:phosphotransferase [Nocardia takedensis]
MKAIYVKDYPDPRRATAAVAHHRWLAGLGAARLPELLDTRTHQLVFEHLGTRYPGPGDLIGLADTLGRTHAAAARGDLARARLDTPLILNTLTIADFHTPRSGLLTPREANIEPRPVAFYKDSNIRNFVLTEDGPALLDFDDLTLAPFGYDLAKLIVSTAMTFGRLPTEDITAALAAYNTATGVEHTIEALRSHCRTHHRLTARYIHRNGYQHSWADVGCRPDSESD